jgi:hypothetical protein
MSEHKITPQHRCRKAIVYLRQSSEAQVRHNRESQQLQYALASRATQLGFRDVEVIDTDLGASASLGARRREGFERLLGAVALGEVGLLLSREASRLSRTDKDWCLPRRPPRAARPTRRSAPPRGTTRRAGRRRGRAHTREAGIEPTPAGPKDAPPGSVGVRSAPSSPGSRRGARARVYANASARSPYRGGADIVCGIITDGGPARPRRGIRHLVCRLTPAWPANEGRTTGRGTARWPRGNARCRSARGAPPSVGRHVKDRRDGG